MVSPPLTPRLLRHALLGLVLTGCQAGAPRPDGGAAEEMPPPYSELTRGVVGGRGAFGEDTRVIPGFAGVHGEGCNLIVLVTDTLRAPRQRIRERYGPDVPTMDERGPCRGHLVIREARFSWSDLARWHDERIRFEELPGVTGHGVNAIRNRIVIGVVDRSEVSAVRTHLERVGVPTEAVIIGISGPIVPPDASYSLLARVVVSDPPEFVRGAELLVLSGSDTIARPVTDELGRSIVRLPGPGRYRVIFVRAPAVRLDPRQAPTAEVEVRRSFPLAETTFYVRPLGT